MEKELLLEDYYIPETTLPFSIGLFTQVRSEAHWHHYWEILYQVEGESEICMDNTLFHSEEGEMTLIGANQIHATRKLSKKHTLLVIQFTLSAVLPYLGTVTECKYPTPILVSGSEEKTHFEVNEQNSHILDLITKIFTEYEKRQIGYETQIHSYLSQIFISLIRNGYLKFHEISEERKQALEKVQESILYMERNFRRNITLEEAARASSISIYNFCRTFKKATEHTFVEYLTYIRLLEAEKMLLTTNRSISDIAYDIGFSSVSYFNKVFKKKYGYPPFLYKKQNVTMREQKF